MRCLYCYNPEIVLGKGKIAIEEAMTFLKSRKGLLDAVVFSGGECLLHKNIIPLIAEIKKMGFLVKIDTNGSSLDVLQQLLDQNLIDYIALDFKAPKAKFEAITQSDLFDPFVVALDSIIKSNVIFEVRTTYHSDLLSQEDLASMVAFLEEKKYIGNYYVQYFKNNVETLSELDYSSNQLDYEELSTPAIKIVVRA